MQAGDSDIEIPLTAAETVLFPCIVCTPHCDDGICQEIRVGGTQQLCQIDILRLCALACKSGAPEWVVQGRAEPIVIIVLSQFYIIVATEVDEWIGITLRQ
jgi:hypothetical protein